MAIAALCVSRVSSIVLLELSGRVRSMSERGISASAISFAVRSALNLPSVQDLGPPPSKPPGPRGPLQ
jgi:hypothetical protein